VGEQVISSLQDISPERRKAFEALLGPGPRPEPKLPHQIPEVLANAKTQVEIFSQCMAPETNALAVMLMAAQAQIDELTRWVERLKGVSLGQQSVTHTAGGVEIRHHAYGDPEKPLCELRWAPTDKQAEIVWLDEQEG
jgi:hypothetical protein